jgi:hypothetical protein
MSLQRTTERIREDEEFYVEALLEEGLPAPVETGIDVRKMKDSGWI